MTLDERATETPNPFEIPPALPPQPMRWRRAFRALRALLDEPEETERAIDLVYAIGRRGFERNFARFAASATGRDLLARRPSLAAALSDSRALARLPEGTLGRAYLSYLEHNAFRATGLLEVERRVQERWEREEGLPRLDPLRAWFRDRSILTHDLFHVVTDYGTDHLGEATLLAFSLAQLGGAANALLTAGAALEVWHVLGWRWLRQDLQAWRRGRSASWLVALPWEELLPLRLETVRCLARVGEANDVHPGGVLRGSLDEHRVFKPA